MPINTRCHHANFVIMQIVHFWGFGQQVVDMMLILNTLEF